jgi:CheY-like chemotaxis protein
MAADTLAQIFEPFFTTKSIDRGTGLGLSQVYGFAKQSGGEIDVASELGAGTAFTLYLPHSVRAPRAVSLLDPIEFSELPGRRILIVEDNEGVGTFAAGLLKELGQEVTWVGDGQAALDLLLRGSEAFDLVFTDVVMPGISGVELARQIRARWPTLEIVLTSGYSHILADEGSYRFPLLKKPYSIDGLMLALTAGRQIHT